MEISVGDIIAGLALLLSAYAIWRSHRFKKKEEELLELQVKVNALLLEKEQREASHVSRAELGATFLTIGSKKHRLKIFNKGRATAHNVSIEFPSGNDAIPESEIQDKFPMETIEPGQSIELIAAVHLGTKRKHAIRLFWIDSDGNEQEKVIHATL